MTLTHSPRYAGNTKRRVRCQSGLMGERSRLRSRYVDCREWTQHAETFNLVHRLGYRSPAVAWSQNPLIESSTNPADFRRVAA